MSGPQLKLFHQRHLSRKSASNITPEIKENSNITNKPSTSKELSYVSKFIRNIGNFFSSLYHKESPPLSTNKETPQVSTKQMKTKHMFLKVKHALIKPKIITEQMKSAKILKQSILKLNNKTYQNNSEIKEIRLKYASLKIKDLSLTEIKFYQDKINSAIIKHNENNISKLKNNINQTIKHFIKKTHSKLQEKMVPIQKSIRARINMLKTSRDIKEDIKKDFSLSDGTAIEMLNQKLIDLYIEKEIKEAFTTSMGTQYDHINSSKENITLGERSDKDIDQDILNLLDNNTELKQKYDTKLSQLFKGISKDIKKETEKLVETVQQNDKVMANIKAIQLSFSSIKQTELALKQSMEDIKDSEHDLNIDKSIELDTIVNNLDTFSQAFINGFYEQTHITSNKIEQAVLKIAESNSNYINMSSEEKDEYIKQLTSYICDRYEKKGVIQSKNKTHFSIDTKIQKKFKLRSNKIKTKERWQQLFITTKSIGHMKPKVIAGKYSDQFKQIESILEKKITLKSNTLTEEELKEIINESIKESPLENCDQEFFTIVHDYTLNRIQDKHMVSHGDAGTIINSNKAVTIVSKKNDFKSSVLHNNPNFRNTLNSMKGQIGKEMRQLMILAENSKGLTSKVESMTKKINESKFQAFSKKSITNIKVNARLTYNKIKTSKDPITAIKSTISDCKKTINSVYDSLNEDTDSTPSIKEEADQTSIKSSKEQENTQSINNNIDKNQEKINQSKEQIEQLQSQEESEKEKQFETLLTSLSHHAGLTNIATDMLNEVTIKDVHSKELENYSNRALKTIEKMKNVVGSNIENVDTLIEQIPYAGQIYSAAKIINHCLKIKDNKENITQLKSIVSSLNSDNIDSIFTEEDTRTDTFSTLLKSKEQHENMMGDLVFSALNISTAPLGVSLGSALKQIYQLNKSGEIQEQDLQDISKNIMTLNKSYNKLTQESQEQSTNQFIDCLKEGNIEKNWDKICDSFMNYSISGVDPEIVKHSIISRNN